VAELLVDGDTVLVDSCRWQLRGNWITEDNYITTEKVRPLVSCDGTAGIRLQVDDVIAIRKKPHRLHLIHPPGHDFYQACRSKLGWSTRPGDSS